MANTPIQIKKSLTTNVPPTLNIGEPAYSYSSNTLFIGAPTEDGAIPIGGYDSYIRVISLSDKLNAVSIVANNGLNVTTGGTVTGDVRIQGNLSIVGGSIGANVPIVLIGDNIISLNTAISQTGQPTMNAGIEIDRGAQPNTYLLWNETLGRWQFTNDGYTYDDLGGSSASSYANSGFIKANASFDHANSGFIKANSAFGHANAAYQSQNATGNVANSAFYQANAAYIAQNATGQYANAAFTLANGAFIHANSGFIQANAAYQSQNATGNTANAAFANANGAFASANAAFANANGAFASANIAFNTGNSAFLQANSAFFHVNAAFANANGAFAKANAGYNHANSAFIQSNSSFGHVNSAFNHANSAYIRANNSLNANVGGQVTGDVVIVGNVTSNTLTTTGSNGSITGANAIFTNYIFAANGSVDLYIYSSLAYAQSNAALAAANASFANANGAFAAANLAFNHANSAYRSQNATGQYANSAFIHANSAYQSQNATGQYANAAFIHANSAFIQTNSAFNHANAAYISQNATGQYANAAFVRANNSLDANNGGTVTGFIDVTQNVSIGTYLDLATDQSNPTRVEGRVFYDNAQHALAYYNESDTTFQIGQEAVLRVWNNTGATISDGKPVYITNDSSANGFPSVALASAATANTAEFIGLTTTTIANSGFGYVTTLGKVNGLNTSLFSEGQELFLSDTPGQYQTSPAASPSVPLVIGYVVVSDVTNGSIYVHTHLMEGRNKSNGAILFARDGVIDQDPTTLYWDYANNSLGVGTATPQANLHVTGSGLFTGNVTISGNLNVTNANFISTSELTVTGNTIIMNNGATGVPTLNAEIIVNRGSSPNVFIRWDESINEWTLSEDGITDSHILTSEKTAETWDVYNAFDAYEKRSYPIGANLSKGIDYQANAAFATANIAEIVAISGFIQANAGFGHANAAYESQNATGQYANSAFIKANSAYESQNATGQYANSSFVHANAAFNHANASYAAANNVFPQIQPAYNTANAAFIRANNSLNANVGGTVTGNVVVIGNVVADAVQTTGSIDANAIFANYIFGANGSIDLTIYANNAYANANAGFAKANSAYDHANAAFLQANTPSDVANSAAIYANGAFLQANTPSYTANSAASYANSAFIVANASFIQVNASFDHANAAFIAANSAAGTYANAAFATANAAYADLNTAAIYANTPSYTANSGAIYANGAFAQANVANNNAYAASLYANASFVIANSGFIQANSAFYHANDAFNKANSGYDQANSAAIYANGSFATANSGSQYANSGFVQANAAFDHANAAFNSANNVAPQVQPAFNTANAAFIQANSSFYHANAAFLAANNALDTWVRGQANAAFIQANAAFDKANTGTAGSNAEIKTLSTLADGTNSTYALGFTATTNTGVIVSVGGIVQTELVDYIITPSNSTISFSDPPPANERIRVAGFNSVTPYYLDVANSAGAIVVSYNGIGDGVTQAFNIGFRPDSGNTIFVSIGGILQPEDAFTVNPSTNTVTFVTAPQSGENIRVVGYNKVNPYYIQYVSSNVSVSTFETTANGNYTTFGLGFLPQAREVLIVSIDGVIQPITSYTVNNTLQSITFDSAPANGELVRVITMYTTANAFITPDASITTIKLAADVTGNINGAFIKANLAFDQANSGFIQANAAFDTANAAATTGKAIAMSIVFGG